MAKEIGLNPECEELRNTLAGNSFIIGLVGEILLEGDENYSELEETQEVKLSEMLEKFANKPKSCEMELEEDKLSFSCDRCTFNAEI